MWHLMPYSVECRALNQKRKREGARNCTPHSNRHLLKPAPFLHASPNYPSQTSRQRARWLFVDDAPGPRGIKAKKGVPRQTWQAIAELGQYNYLMEESDVAGTATR